MLNITSRDLRELIDMILVKVISILMKIGYAFLNHIKIVIFTLIESEDSSTPILTPANMHIARGDAKCFRDHREGLLKTAVGSSGMDAR